MVALGALAAFVLPHQFHVGVVELRRDSDLKTARDVLEDFIHSLEES